MRLMLIPGNATFRRSVRDEKGEVLRILKFEEGVVSDLKDADLEAVRKDIGPALCIARDDREQPDWKATEAFVSRKGAKGKKQKQPVGAE